MKPITVKNFITHRCKELLEHGCSIRKSTKANDYVHEHSYVFRCREIDWSGSGEDYLHTVTDNIKYCPFC